ncbi:MAG: sugar phosphate isomerase/epimerase [Victivallales bacterium]|nr:sugar phosphate isomerase/epimerase [Victivallales bacterium]
MNFSLLSCCMCGKSPETAIQTAKEIGFSAIDWVTLCGKTPDYLRRITLDAGLEIGTYTFVLKDFPDRKWHDAAKREIANAVALGASAVMLPPSEIAGIHDRVLARRLWMEALSEIVPLANRANLIFTIENYAGVYSPCITYDDFLEFRKEISSLCLTFDCGNAFTGEDPRASLQKSIPYIENIHIKDWSKSRCPQSAGSCRMPDGMCYDMTLPMNGIVPIRELMADLGRLEYRRNIVLEYIYADYPLPVQRKMLAELKDILHE